MARLRDPQNGCEWDCAQSFESIAPYTIEEAYEVADAIERNDMPALRDELGDLLFQVAFHARMAEEAGLFDFEDVADTIADKMLRRHPHVFGDASERAAGHNAARWEQIKADERQSEPDSSALAGVARALPALSRAEKLGKRASRVGFDWPDTDGVISKVREEFDELAEASASGDTAAVEEELGDLLFSVVNLARHLQVDPEAALTRGNRKFERRFRAMEAQLAGSGAAFDTLSLEELEQAWSEAKKAVG